MKATPDVTACVTTDFGPPLLTPSKFTNSSSCVVSPGQEGLLHVGVLGQPLSWHLPRPNGKKAIFSRFCRGGGGGPNLVVNVRSQSARDI